MWRVKSLMLAADVAFLNRRSFLLCRLLVLLLCMRLKSRVRLDVSCGAEFGASVVSWAWEDVAVFRISC